MADSPLPQHSRIEVDHSLSAARKEWYVPPTGRLDTSEASAKSFGVNNSSLPPPWANSPNQSPRRPTRHSVDDAYALEDVSVGAERLKMLSTAAADLAQLNGSAFAAIDRLNAAVRHLHSDEVGLAMQQQRQASRLETVWHTCADVREEVADMRVTLRRHIQTSTEVQSFLQLEAKRHESILQRLLRRTSRNESLLRNEASRRIEKVTHQCVRSRFWAKWREFSRRRSVYRVVLRRTRLGRIHGAFATWRLWAQWSRKQMKYFRALEFTEEKNSRYLGRRYLQKFVAFVMLRRRLKKTALWLQLRTDRGALNHRFSLWRRHAERCQALRAALMQKVKLSGAVGSKAQRRLVSRYFASWAAFRLKRQKRTHLRDVALRLSRRLTGERGKHLFLLWKSFAKRGRINRSRADRLSIQTNKATLRRIFRDWQQLRFIRWIGREIRSAVGEVDTKVDIGLKTTSNMNETIQRMIENYHQLSQTTAELNRSKVSHHQLRASAFRETTEQGTLHDRFQELVRGENPGGEESTFDVSFQPQNDDQRQQYPKGGMRAPSGFDDPMRGVVQAGALSAMRGPSFAASRSESPSTHHPGSTRRTHFGATVQSSDPSRIGGPQQRFA